MIRKGVGYRGKEEGCGKEKKGVGREERAGCRKEEKGVRGSERTDKH
jgi:hypothetical protein